MGGGYLTETREFTTKVKKFESYDGKELEGDVQFTTSADIKKGFNLANLVLY